MEEAARIISRILKPAAMDGPQPGLDQEEVINEDDEINVDTTDGGVKVEPDDEIEVGESPPGEDSETEPEAKEAPEVTTGPSELIATSSSLGIVNCESCDVSLDNTATKEHRVAKGAVFDLAFKTEEEDFDKKASNVSTILFC